MTLPPPPPNPARDGCGAGPHLLSDGAGSLAAQPQHNEQLSLTHTRLRVRTSQLHDHWRKATVSDIMTKIMCASQGNSTKWLLQTLLSIDFRVMYKIC